MALDLFVVLIYAAGMLVLGYYGMRRAKTHAQLWPPHRGRGGWLVRNLDLRWLVRRITRRPGVIDLGAGGIIEHQETPGGQVETGQSASHIGIGTRRHALMADEGSTQRNILRRHEFSPGY